MSCAYRILLRTSSGSTGFGRRMRQIATHPATTIDVMMMPAASTRAARIIICDWLCFSWLFCRFFWFDVSAGVGSSEMIVSSGEGDELELAERRHHESLYVHLPYGDSNEPTLTRSMTYGGSLRPLAFTAYTWKWYSRPGSSGGILNWGTFSWIRTNGANVAYCACVYGVRCRFRGRMMMAAGGRSKDASKREEERNTKDINQYTRSCQPNDKLLK